MKMPSCLFLCITQVYAARTENALKMLSLNPEKSYTLVCFSLRLDMDALELLCTIAKTHELFIYCYW